MGSVSAIQITQPEDWNPAHAEIPQKITRDLANKILPELKLHFFPGKPQGRTFRLEI